MERLKVAPEAEPHLDRLRNATAELAGRLTLPGIVVQTKQVGLSIHYRTSNGSGIDTGRDPGGRGIHRLQ